MEANQPQSSANLHGGHHLQTCCTHRAQVRSLPCRSSCRDHEDLVQVAWQHRCPAAATSWAALFQMLRICVLHENSPLQEQHEQLPVLLLVWPGQLPPALIASTEDCVAFTRAGSAYVTLLCGNICSCLCQLLLNLCEPTQAAAANTGGQRILSGQSPGKQGHNSPTAAARAAAGASYTWVLRLRRLAAAAQHSLGSTVQLPPGKQRTCVVSTAAPAAAQGSWSWDSAHTSWAAAAWGLWPIPSSSMRRLVGGLA